MKRIQIAALSENRKEILEYLQRKGIVEVSDEENDSLARINTADTISQFEKYISTAIQAKAVIDEYAPQKQSMLASLNDRRELTEDEYKKHFSHREAILKDCYHLVECQKTIADKRAEIVKAQTQADILKVWLSLDIPMSFEGTRLTRCFIGTLPAQYTKDELLGKIAEINPELKMLDIEIAAASKEQTCIAALSHKCEANDALAALRELGFAQTSEPIKQKPKAKLLQIENEIAGYKKEIEENINIIKSYSDKADKIEFLIDHLTMRRDRYHALNKVGLTKRTFILRGYIPEKYACSLTSELENKFDIAISVTEPAEEDDVPVLLQNNGFAAPVESITEMYALPTKGDVDPSPVMAFFYYFFFGMMLSDAGYGLVMVIVSALLLSKFRLKDSMKKSLKMFMYCGISTVFWGAMFGSWFGDIVSVINVQFLGGSTVNLAIWFDPIKDPMKLLLWAFAFGIVHLFVGLGVKFVMLWKDGKKADAIFDVIPAYMLVLGAAPLAGGILTPVPPIFALVGKYMALAGVVLVILTASRSSKNILARLGGGLYGLYNMASGYLSDVLSYSRLLALGLATGSIAGVVNLMGSMSGNLVLKGIILTVVFVVGHSLNIAINLLGAYVHTNRLQFVEFFSKFYEGGGRAFDPLKVNTKYIRFKEEIQNG